MRGDPPARRRPPRRGNAAPLDDDTAAADEVPERWAVVLAHPGCELTARPGRRRYATRSEAQMAADQDAFQWARDGNDATRLRNGTWVISPPNDPTKGRTITVRQVNT